MEINTALVIEKTIRRKILVLECYTPGYRGRLYRWHAYEPGEPGVEVAEPQTFSLAEYMPGKRTIWAEIVKKHQLKPYDLDTLVQWGFGDFIFNVEADAFFDVNKARRFGFHEMNGDSLKIFLDAFKRLKNEQIIP